MLTRKKLAHALATTYEASRFASKYEGFYEKLDAFIRFVQFQDLESTFDRLKIPPDERDELRKTWLETPGNSKVFYRKCAACQIEFDPLFRPATGPAPTTTICSACVQAQQEADGVVDAQKDDVHRSLALAAKYAVKLKWDLAKFQDESAAYFIETEKSATP